MDEKIYRFSIQILIHSCLAIAFFIGLFECFHWYTQSAFINNPNYLGMAFNTSLGVTLASVGILLAIHKKRLFSFLIGVLVLLLGVTTISEYVFHINLDIDELFIRYRLPITAPILHIQMAPNSAIAFFLLGLILIFLKNYVLRRGYSEPFQKCSFLFHL